MHHVNPLLGAGHQIHTSILLDKARDALADNMSEGVFVVDAGGHIVYANLAMESISGYSIAELMGKRPSVFHSGVHDESFYADLWCDLINRGAWSGFLWNRKKNGQVGRQYLRIHALREEGVDDALGYQAIVLDVGGICSSGKDDSGSTIARNRSSFMLLLRGHLTSRPDDICAVCVLDVDGFKRVNETYGHKAGDQVLIELMARLRHNLRDDDAVTRLSGDEFAFILPQMSSPDSVSAVLSRLQNAMQAPYTLEGEIINLTTSLGVAVYPYDRGSPEDLFRHADEALALSKSKGAGCITIYESPDAGDFSPNERIHAQIRSAIARHEFVLYYQPKVDMATGDVLGMEALLRWEHPERGFIAPDDFLSRVRSQQVLIELGEWVINEALSTIGMWKRKHGILVNVSVNLVAEQIASPGFVRRLSSIAESHPDAPLSCLEIEIIQTGTIAGHEEILSMICAARDMGVTFSIDDFSTGSITLGSLRHMPATSVKVDKFFVQGMLGSQEDLSIIDAAIDMARKLGRRVVAEGVETEEQGVLLLSRGCRYAQGYFIAKPMPAENVVWWTGNYRPPESWFSFSL